MVHGELQRLRQRQVSCCQGSAQGLGAVRLHGERCCAALQLSGTNYQRNDSSWSLQLIEIVVGLWVMSFLSEEHTVLLLK